MNYFVERGRLLLENGRTKDAEREFRKALSEDPDNSIALALLAECALNNKDYQRGLDHIQRAVAIQPNEPLLLYILAKAQFLNKQLSTAKNSIHQALTIAPNDPDFFYLSAQISYYEENWEEALQYTEQGLRLEPEDTTLSNLHAQCLIKLNRTKEANATLEFTLQHAPENSYTHANKGWVALESNQYPESLAHFKEALRLDPENEFARTGLKEAIKAKNLIYRWVLKYFLWTAKLNQRNRWFFIIGIYILYRILLGVVSYIPVLAPIIYPLVGLYILFAFSSWIALPISNLFLRLHPLGRNALTSDELYGSSIVGGLILGSLLLLILFFATQSITFALAALCCAGMLIPVGGLFGVSPGGKARKILTYYTLGMTSLGVAIIIFQNSMLLLAFVIALFVYGWLANYWMGKDAKEFA